jgi:hypothetical protein
MVSSATSNCASEVTHYSSCGRQVVLIIFDQSRVLRVALLAIACSVKAVLLMHTPLDLQLALMGYVIENFRNLYLKTV